EVLEGLHQQFGAAFAPDLREAYGRHAEVLLQLGRYETAAAAAQKIPPLSPQGWQAYYRAARLLSQCLRQAEKDSGQAEVERRRVAERLATGAVQFLEAALAKGFTDAKQLRQDAAFQSLESHSNYQKLLEKIGER